MPNLSGRALNVSNRQDIGKRGGVPGLSHGVNNLLHFNLSKKKKNVHVGSHA